MEDGAVVLVSGEPRHVHAPYDFVLTAMHRAVDTLEVIISRFPITSYPRRQV